MITIDERGIAMRLIIIFITVVFLSCNLLACSDKTNTSIPSFDNSSIDPNAQEPIPNTTFFFNTYAEFFHWMHEDTNEQRDDLTWGNEYYNYVNEVSQNLSSFSIPYFKGVPMKLREKEGFSGIVFMTSELYNLPWIWYYGSINGNEVVVKQACLSQKYLTQEIGKTASQFIGKLAPDAPNVNNIDSFPTYKEIKEEMISLSGQTVSSIVYELKNDTRISVTFRLDGALYIVTAQKEVLNNDFWSVFTMNTLYDSSDLITKEFQ